MKLLSNGESIDIEEEESLQLKIISIFLENDELLSKLNDMYPSKIDIQNIDLYLTNLTILYQISPMFHFFNYTNIIDFISSHFYLIDQDMLNQLPIEIIHSIILNSNLRLESEDSLFDFIHKLSEEKYKSSDIIALYENIDFRNLSENKFNFFIKNFDFTKMTCDLWKKLCLLFHNRSSQVELASSRYIYKGKSIIIDPENPNSMCGIIDFLSKESGGNVSENGTVIVTSSSLDCYLYDVKHVVNVHGGNNYFCSSNVANSWLKYDFVKRKVYPTHYTIRSRPEYNFDHPINWVIEGSNTDDDSDWTILDCVNENRSLVGLNKVCTFEIKYKKESFRFLRIRQTGLNSSDQNFLVFAALEYFGLLSE